MTLYIVNPTDRDWTKHRFILAFGAYGETKLLVWANHLEDALGEAIDWCVDHAPGYIVDDQVNEAYNEAMAEGKSEDEAFDYSQEDVTCGGNCGHYILSHEWHILAEDPTRERVIQVRDESAYRCTEPTAAVYRASK